MVGSIDITLKKAKHFAALFFVSVLDNQVYLINSVSHIQFIRCGILSYIVIVRITLT